jgi:hypothetical protein
LNFYSLIMIPLLNLPIEPQRFCSLMIQRSGIHAHWSRHILKSSFSKTPCIPFQNHHAYGHALYLVGMAIGSPAPLNRTQTKWIQQCQWMPLIKLVIKPETISRLYGSATIWFWKPSPLEHLGGDKYTSHKQREGHSRKNKPTMVFNKFIYIS